MIQQEEMFYPIFAFPFVQFKSIVPPSISKDLFILSQTQYDQIGKLIGLWATF